ncbi:MAG TPA: copper resistance protein CopC [Gaiellaceae bacterium]
MRLRVAVATAAAAAALPAPAWAHAILVRSEPADRAVLARPPAAVRLVFSDLVTPGPGIAAIRNDGGSVLDGKAHTKGTVLVVPLKPGLPNGDYTVRWSVISDDGHLVSGVLAFGVGIGRAPPAPALVALNESPGAESSIERWLALAGVLVASGTALFVFAVWRPTLRRVGLAEGHERAADDAAWSRLSVLLVLGCVVFLIGAASDVDRITFATRFGAALGAGALAALVGGTLAAVSLLDANQRLPAAVAAVGLVAVPSVGGHALDPNVPWLNLPLDILHIGAAALWIGCLLALVAVVPTAQRAAGAAGPALVGAVVRRVSAVALGSVAVLGATGVVRAWYELDAVHELWTTGYGRALLVKTGLLACLVGLGWINRTRLVPLIREAGTFVRLRRNVSAELVLLAAAVGAVAVLVQLPPAKLSALAARSSARVAAGPTKLPPPPPDGALVLARRAGNLAVGLAVERPPDGTLTASVLAPSGGGFSGLPVSFSVGGERLQASACGAGCYRASLSGPLPRRVGVLLGSRFVSFDLPARWPASATRLVHGATRAVRSLKTLVYRERLASHARPVVSLWQEQAPNRLHYRIAGGPQGIVVGARRWDRDRPGGRWQESSQSPLQLPVPAWGTSVLDAHLLSAGPRTLRVSFVDPQIPAWFDVELDRRTLLPRTIGMIAAAHFMTHTYLAFNRPFTIRPPR